MAVALRGVGKLPLKVIYRIFKFPVWVLRDIVRYRKDEVYINVARSFPEKTYDEIKTIVRDFYDNLGDILAETIWFGSSYNNPERIRKQNLGSVKNLEEVDEVLEKGKSVVLLSSHCGNWELVGALGEFIGDKKNARMTEDNIIVVYRRLSNRFWDDFMRKNRTAIIPEFKGYIETEEVIRFMFENKDKQHVYVFPTDQYPYGRAKRYEVKSFLNQKTYSMTGGASVAHKFGMACFVMIMRKTDDKKYEYYFHKICEDASAMTPEEITERYYRCLEEEIKLCPSNYLWSHKRWR